MLFLTWSYLCYCFRVYLGLFAAVICVGAQVGVEEIALKQDEERSFPTECQVCRFLVEEISLHLNKSGKSHDVLQLGSQFQGKQKKVKYSKSELRLTEAVEDACQKMLEYKVHKDRPIRYARGESTTFRTLNGLKKRGVKVNLGIPDEMWDIADGEVYKMKSECERLVEAYEDQISTWYYKYQDKNLTQWLCAERILPRNKQDCLSISPSDTFAKDKKDDSEKDENKNKKTTSKKTSKKKKKENDKQKAKKPSHGDL